MNIRGLNRWQAFLVHLGISLIIFIVLLCIIVFVWYPGVFINMGGWQGIRIVAAVDLVLGPLLTLIVFNPAKKSLNMDLTIIAVIQLSCLIYGVWTIEQARPLTQIILDDRLYVTPKAEYKEQGIATDFVDTIPGPFPKMIMLDMPNDSQQIAQTVITGDFTDNPLHLRTQLYLPVLSDKPAHEQKLEWLLKRMEFDKEKDCYWFPAYTAYFTGELCFDIQRGAIYQRPLSIVGNSAASQSKEQQEERRD